MVILHHIISFIMHTYNTIYYPKQLTQQDIEYSSTLEQSDIGRWYILINGCYQFVSDDTIIVL